MWQQHSSEIVSTSLKIVITIFRSVFVLSFFIHIHCVQKKRESEKNHRINNLVHINMNCRKKIEIEVFQNLEFQYQNILIYELNSEPSNRQGTRNFFFFFFWQDHYINKTFFFVQIIWSIRYIIKSWSITFWL